MSTPASSSRSASVIGLWIVGILLLASGFALRLVDLDRASYTIDEINVIRDAVGQKSVGDIYRTELERFTWYHRLPFLMAVIHVWTKTFGTGAAAGTFPAEDAARFPFALIGALSLPLFFILGRRVGGVPTGFWLFAFVTLNVFHVFYSREAYDYVLVMTFAAAALWAGYRVLQEWERAPGFNLWTGLAMAASSWALLQSHLSGLLFLAPWHGLIGLTLFLRARRTKAWMPLVLWAGAILLPYLLFMPFVIRVFNFVTTESPVANRVSWAIVPALLGRMGWGEHLYALLPFAACVIAGAYALARSGSEARTGRLLLLQLALFLLIQTYALRVSRFEVRYYAPLAPLLLLLAARGLAALQVKITHQRVRWIGPIVAGLIVLGLNAPSLLAVVQLECRGGYAYKSLANWINTNLPPNGVYSYWNVYDARGVPTVYPTPDRHMAYPLAWSSAEDYRSQSVPQRLTSFFMRFPTAAYVETAPVDLYAPDKITCPPINRDALFMNRQLLTDPAYKKLVRWATLPLGTAQPESAHMDEMLVSWNRRSDLPELARRRGQALYHDFGPEWVYRKDNQMNDWMSIESGGTFQIGNISSSNLAADIRFTAFAHPEGCQLNLYSSSGGLVLGGIQIPSQPQEFRIPRQELPPGMTEYLIEIVPPRTGTKSLLLVYSLGVSPLAP